MLLHSATRAEKLIHFCLLSLKQQFTFKMTGRPSGVHISMSVCLKAVELVLLVVVVLKIDFDNISKHLLKPNVKYSAVSVPAPPPMFTFAASVTVN